MSGLALPPLLSRIRGLPLLLMACGPPVSLLCCPALACYLSCWHNVHLWTDGSVYLPQHPFLAAAGFAVVSGACATVDSGPVPGVFADNYRAEVYAIVRAATHARGHLVVHTDSQAAVPISGSGGVVPHLAAADLWQGLWAVVQSRAVGGFSLESVAASAVTHPLAADLAAKAAARASLAAPVRRLDALFFATYRRSGSSAFFRPHAMALCVSVWRCLRQSNLATGLWEAWSSFLHGAVCRWGLLPTGPCSCTCGLEALPFGPAVPGWPCCYGSGPLGALQSSSALCHP